MKTRNRNQSGFTLIEVLIGMIVFAIGMLGSLSLLSWIIRADAFNTRLARAGNVGQTCLETLREEGYDGASSGSDTQGIFELTWTVSAATGSVRTVDVAVEWDNADGVHKQTDLSTMVLKDQLTPILPSFVLPSTTTVVTP